MCENASNGWRQEYATQGVGAPDKELPVNVGRLEGDLVVIEECVVCGEAHRHGSAGFVNGWTTRVGHCRDQSPEYAIRLEGVGSA